MEISIAGNRIAYSASGSGKTVLLLHGWGVDRSVMEPLRERLAQSFHAVSIDLPGFGESPPPDSAWGVTEYADCVRRFCAELGIRQPVILGHSFGGRLAILLGADSQAAKLILVDSAGILPKRGTSYYARIYSYKAAKALLWLLGRERREQILTRMREKRGSGDYARAEGIMREILVKVVNHDLTLELHRITAPTLLIWGENDTATPLTDARLMEKLIPDAGLVVFAGGGHYPFLEQPERFYAIAECFIGQE